MFWPKHLHGPSELAITITIEMERACFPLLIGKNGSRKAALKSHISVSWNAYISNLALYRMLIQAHLILNFPSGCRWSYVIRTGDEGCREDESGDGTQYWYQMANCRRANVAYALYDGSSGRCSKNTFLENVSCFSFGNFEVTL